MTGIRLRRGVLLSLVHPLNESPTVGLRGSGLRNQSTGQIRELQKPLIGAAHAGSVDRLHSIGCPL
jgi:hypothetical protein